jgi:hypothetical protein
VKTNCRWVQPAQNDSRAGFFYENLVIKFKRILKLGIFGLLLLVVSAAGLWYYVGLQGTSPLEQWIGSQIVGVLESHITPKVSFGTLDYQAPLAVVIDKLTLTSQNVQIMSIERTVLELAEIPKQSQPIRIQKIELKKPHLKFVRSPKGEFVGWQPFVRPDVAHNLNAAPEGQRFSDVLALRGVTIRAGEIVYDQGDGSKPMVLPDIDLALDTPPVVGEPGWYALAGTLQRKPVFQLELGARVNFDTGLLDVEKLNLTTALSDREYSSLPPQVQEVLARYEVQGQLNASVHGQIPLDNPSLAKAEVHASLKNAKMAYHGKRYLVEQLKFDADCREQKVIAKCDADTLGGKVTVQANVQLTGAKPFDLSWQINNIELEKILQAQSGAPRYAGQLVSIGKTTGRLAELPASISGSGKLSIDNGQLMNMPIIHELLAVVAKVKLGLDLTPRDKARVEFGLTGDHIQVNEAEVNSALIGLRGHGQIFYDSRLNLDMNVRVTDQVQGALQNVGGAVGKVGGLIGAVSDKMVTYHVGGTWSQPSVGIKPLGLGLPK